MSIRDRLQKTVRPPSEPLRVRNLGIRRVRVADLADAPWNHRTHPQSQAAALDGAIDELGFYSYPDVYEAAGGVLMLIDGHLRKERLLARYGADAEIEVNVTDFDEAEAKKANLTKDPLAAMAEESAEKLDALLRDVHTGDTALAAMLDRLAQDSGVVPGDSTEPSIMPLDVKPLPVMAWALIGIPIVRYGEVSEAIESLAIIPGIIIEITSNNG